MTARLLEPLLILFGAGFTAAVSLALGRVLLRRLNLRLYRAEEWAFSFVLGAAILSLAVFALCAAQIAYPAVFLAAGAVSIGAALRAGAFRPQAKPFPALPALWRRLFLAVFSIYTVLYFFNAMAPELSPDGSGYHLGLVYRYLREHGFPRITTHMYSNLSQGVEMLFLFAFAFGRHSAAALVHFAFLVTLPVLMLSYGRRFGLAQAGAWGALFVFVSPIIGVDGISAYNDVAVATLVFSVFYLLQIWDRERAPGLLPAIGLAAGFCYASKYTAFLAVPYALVFVGWKAGRKRQAVLSPLLVISLCALIMILPWVVKNWIVLQNPFSPFLNGLFPNPNVYVSFEKDYAQHMRNYEGLRSRRDIPYELLLGGALAGFLGPLFALAPLALLALRRPEGRRLLLAALLFGSPWLTNIGARFLIPAMPFAALAMALVLSEWKRVAPALALVHAVISWPSVLERYAPRYAWRLENIPVRQALRIESEDSFLNFKMPLYSVARMVEQNTPPGAKVFTYSSVPESYTTREILVAYQAAFNNRMGDILWNPLLPDFAPTWHLRFRFPSQPLRGIRVVQTASGVPDLWSVGELRVFDGNRELPREPGWRLRAHPNPWDVQLAFDNSPVTRWRSWQSLFSGMFLDVDFGGVRTAGSVLVECSHDQSKIKLKLEGRDAGGAWRPLAAAPEESDAPPLLGLRRAATRELKWNGIDYLLIFQNDFGAEDFRSNAPLWGITEVREHRGARLYRID